MPRSIFGWSYPPGCHSVPGDEPDPPCEICGKDPDDCVCPECPRCGCQGDPQCYAEPDLGVCAGLHETPLTARQKLGKAEFEAACLKDQWQDALQYVDYLKEKVQDDEDAALAKRGFSWFCHECKRIFPSRQEADFCLCWADLEEIKPAP
jgi:hypothetical protein